MSSVDCGFEEQNLLVEFGPTLGVRIGFDPNYSPNGSSPPNLPEKLWPALVDTGASESCIDSTLADELQLPVFDRVSISGVHGKQELNLHLAQIYVPSLQFTTYGRFAGVHLISGGQRHYALIGRSFLRNFNMVYNGKTGSVTLSRLFR